MRNKSPEPGFNFGNWNRNSWNYSARETIWYVIMFITPLLTIRLGAGVVKGVEVSEIYPSVPQGFFPVALLNLLLCASVPLLLRRSEGTFRTGAIILTSAVPALFTCLLLYRTYLYTG